jgi:hypothetical protein
MSDESKDTDELKDKKTNDKREWTSKIEDILDRVRINCVNLSEYHSNKYYMYKSKLVYFRIPIIFLSGINTFASVGLQPFIGQGSISVITSIISLICGIITSVELFLNIQKKMEIELSSHKDYYRLSVEIFKVISLDRSKRTADGKAFLEEKFGEYEKLIQSSNARHILKDEIVDVLAPNYSLSVYKKNCKVIKQPANENFYDRLLIFNNNIKEEKEDDEMSINTFNTEYTNYNKPLQIKNVVNNDFLYHRNSYNNLFDNQLVTKSDNQLVTKSDNQPVTKTDNQLVTQLNNQLVIVPNNDLSNNIIAIPQSRDGKQNEEHKDNSEYGDDLSDIYGSDECNIV